MVRWLTHGDGIRERGGWEVRQRRWEGGVDGAKRLWEGRGGEVNIELAIFNGHLHYPWRWHGREGRVEELDTGDGGGGWSKMSIRWEGRCTPTPLSLVFSTSQWLWPWPRLSWWLLNKLNVRTQSAHRKIGDSVKAYLIFSHVLWNIALYVTVEHHSGIPFSSSHSVCIRFQLEGVWGCSHFTCRLMIINSYVQCNRTWLKRNIKQIPVLETWDLSWQLSMRWDSFICLSRLFIPFLRSTPF